MKKFGVLTIIIAFSLFSFGQLVRITPPLDPSPAVSKVQKLKVKVQKSKVSPHKPITIIKQENTEPDTVYAISTVKQHGWYKPLRTIEKKNANRYELVFVFSNKNESGNWRRIEYINNYGKPTYGRIEPYIMKLNSETDALDWVEKIRTITRVDMIPDASGEQVVQERAYDKDGKLVYSFSVSPIDDSGKKFVGSYKDFYGLPAEMRMDKSYSYGTLIYIERDRWGNDSLLRYMDSKGFVKPNSDGVYAENFIYDEYGRVRKHQSADAEGNLIFDGTGNCGYEYEYDDQHNLIKSLCMDPSWTPMKLQGKNDEIGYIYKYDEYGRTIEQINIDENDNPIENALGTNKISLKYDIYGNNCEYTGYNLKNELSPINANLCKTELKYDHLGNLLEERNFDSDEKPVYNPNYYSTVIVTMDYSTGEKQSENQYRADENGEEFLDYSYIRKGKETVTTYSDQSKKIEIYDDQNRIKEIRYLDIEGELDDWEATPLKEYLYDVPLENYPVSNPYLNDRINVTTSYNSYGQIVERIYANADSSYLIVSRYDQNAQLEEIFGQEKKDGLVIRQDDLNKYGIITRAARSEGTLNYHANILHSLNGDISGIYGTDEFGEPNYVSDGKKVYYKSNKGIKKGQWNYFNIDEQQIQNFSLLRGNLSKYFSIEIVDSLGYVNGFRDNDIILAINGSVVNPLSKESDFLAQNVFLRIQSITDAKEILVYRIDPETLKSYCEIINIGPGALEEYGIKLHEFFSTERQAQKINSAFDDYKKENSIDFKYFDGDRDAVAILDNLYLQYGEDNGILDNDAILLAVQCNEYPLIYWKWGEEKAFIENLIDGLENIMHSLDASLSSTMYFTKDGKTIEKVEVEDISYFDFISSRMSEEQFVQMQSLAQTIHLNTKDRYFEQKNVKNLSDKEKKEMFHHADVYYEIDYNDIAFNIYKKLYDSGYHEVEDELMLCYLHGIGTTKDLKKAEKIAKGKEENSEFLSLIADEYLKAGKDKEAYNLLKKISSQDRFYDRIQKQLGDIVIKIDTLKAREHYFNALNNLNSLAFNYETPDLLRSFSRLNNFEELKDSISQVGINFFENEDFWKAYSIFSALEVYNDKISIIYLCLNNLFGFVSKPNFVSAREYAEKLYNYFGSTGGYYLIGEFYIEDDEFQNALNILNKWKDKGDDQFIMKYEIGQIYNNPDYFGHNANQVLEAYTDALSSSDYLDHKEVDEIISFYNENFSDHPLTAQGKFYLGREYFRNNRISEALDLFNEAYSIDPELKENPDLSPFYYKAHHKYLLQRREEYEEFMQNHIFQITYVEPIDPESPTEGSGEEILDVLSIDEWDLTDLTPGCSIYDIIKNKNKKMVLKPSGVTEIKSEDLIIMDCFLNFDDYDFRLIYVPVEYKSDAVKTYMEYNEKNHNPESSKSEEENETDRSE